MTLIEEQEFRKRIERAETLIQGIERFADPAAQVHTRELVQTLLDFHGAGLTRILEQIARAGEPGRSIIDSLADDDLVGSLFLLYGLHPQDLATRVGRALEKVRPYLRSHGGNVELLGVAEGAVRLRMQGSCHGCPSSAMTLKLAIEEAIYEIAPDVVAIEVEGVVERRADPPLAFIPTEQLLARNGAEHQGRGGWEEVRDLESLAVGSVQTRDVVGRPVLFCRVGEALYAYGDTCPNCARSLGRAKLAGAALTCPTCGHSYDVVRAGGDRDQPGLHLEPFPLLVSNGQVKVSLPS